MIVFSTDLDDKSKGDIEKCRSVLYEIFDDKGFVTDKVKMIEDDHLGYIEKLYKQGIIYLWTSLESFIKDLIFSLIKYDDNFLSNVELSKINIPMAEYFSYDDDDKILFLTELIIEKTNSARKRGINRFEGYLKPFNLDGPLDRNHKMNLFQLQQIRNCIVHNNSIVDKKFYDNCKQLGFNIGDEITIKQEDHRKYEISVLAYIMEVFFRLNRNLGAPKRYLGEVKNRLDSLFQNDNEDI